MYPLKLFFDQLQQKFFSFTHSVLTKHIIIKIVSLSHPEMEMGIKLKICFKTRDGNRKTVYARLFVPTVQCKELTGFMWDQNCPSFSLNYGMYVTIRGNCACNATLRSFCDLDNPSLSWLTLSSSVRVSDNIVLRFFFTLPTP